MDMAQVRSIASLRRGIDVLSLVENHHRQGLVLHGLHVASGIPKASLLRILKTLIECGVVRKRAGDGAYLPAERDASRTISRRSKEAQSLVAPQLREATGERLRWPSDLAVPDGLKMRVVDSNRSAFGRVWLPSVIGEEVDMLDSAMGRAYLAFIPEEMCRRLVDLHLSQGNARARRREAIEREIALTRQRGYGQRDFLYAGPDTDHGRQLSAIAVPILRGASAVACVSCVWDLRTTSRAEVLEWGLAHLVRLASTMGDRHGEH